MTTSPTTNPATSPATTRSVAVLGSCITRDNFNRRFNAEYKRWFRVGPTTNQSSMIALLSPPIDEPWKPVKEMKPYGLWNVRSDLSREILDLLRTEQPELITLDFFGDVHFGVLRMADGRYLTNNRWRIWKTDLYVRLQEDERTVALRWQDDEDGYFALWTEEMDRFAAYVAEHCPRSRVVVHCGFNARQVMKPDEPLPAPLGPQGKAARRANVFWSRLNAHARDAYGWEHIDLGGEWYTSFTEHPWGPFAVHYTMDYYHRFLAELNRLSLHIDLPDELAERVDAVGQAASRRVREELDHWRSLDKRLSEGDQSPRRGLRRLLGRSSGTVPERPPLASGEDHRLLAALRDELDEATFERVEQLPLSADEHVAWIRSVWEPKIALRRSGAAGA
jgi:hypothetical protein